MGTKVVVMGQGYVGLPLAVAAAERGYEVVGFEVDETRVKKLAVGESYVGDIDSARLAALLDSGAYRPTMEQDDLAGFDIAVITVPTPMRKRGLRLASRLMSRTMGTAKFMKKVVHISTGWSLMRAWK